MRIHKLYGQAEQANIAHSLSSLAPLQRKLFNVRLLLFRFPIIIAHTMCDLKRKHKLFSIFILIIKCARDPQQICALARQFLMMANHFMCNAMRCKAFQARCHYYQYRFIICNAIFVSISVVIKFNDFIDEFLHFGWGFCIKRAHRLDFFSSKNAIYWNRFPLRVRVKEMENALQIDAIWTRWEDVPKKANTNSCKHLTECNENGPIRHIRLHSIWMPCERCQAYLW